MTYNKRCNLWPTKESFFKDKEIHPIRQSGPHCVSTVLAMLTDKKPEDFQNNKLNTQDPISWSDCIKPYGMKLAYCPTDVRKLKFYIDELIALNDLFLLCYYSPTGSAILSDPDDSGWVCGSHVVILHRNQIIDPKRGDKQFAKEHKCNEKHTKRIFRVVPVHYERGL
jgi:hypothetical protein